MTKALRESFPPRARPADLTGTSREDAEGHAVANLKKTTPNPLHEFWRDWSVCQACHRGLVTA